VCSQTLCMQEAVGDRGAKVVRAYAAHHADNAPQASALAGVQLGPDRHSTEDEQLQCMRLNQRL